MNAKAWNIYRTRFLIQARQLTEPMMFVDFLGREHRGQPGDYLIESSGGRRSIQPREIFEDIYVAMGPANLGEPSQLHRAIPVSEMRPPISATRSSASA